MNGVLVVDKPAGPSSHDVVARVRRALGTARVGHTGTLDPLATGVLPLVIGRATRLARFLSGADKAYVAGVRFGAATDTYDAQGREPSDTPPAPPGVSAAAIARALPELRGTYRQTPPPYSAKKVGGTRAYRLARSNKPVTLTPAEVRVSALDLEAYEDGLARLRIVCSSGFYVRTLAHELGQRLGCGAHLESLRRTRVGEFTAGQAIPLAEIEEMGPAAAAHVLPMEGLLGSLPSVVVTERGARRAAHGNSLPPEDLVPPLPPPGAACVRLVDGEGALVAVAEPEPDGLLHPVVVLV